MERRITNLYVPEEITFISEWKDFKLPESKIILNKKICGCGFTNYFLSNDEPIVIVSPRIELINSKIKSPEFEGKVFYFKSGDKEIENKLENYLVTTPIPKILVTFDKFTSQLYKYLQSKKIKFRFVVDEWQCMITDSHLKGSVEIQLLRIMEDEPNIVLLSATPIKEEFLNSIFTLLPFEIIELIWSEKRVRKVNISFKPLSRTITETCEEIINGYREKGYFAKKIIFGREYESKEALFFLNNLTQIIAVVRKYKLKPEECFIICGNEKENNLKLKSIGFPTNQHLNTKQNQKKNPTFTFLTRTAFQGADIYSDNATTFVFSNPNLETLCLDLSIDLPQICGRVRNFNNPFRDEVTLYYKEFTQSEEEYKKNIDKKLQDSITLLKQIQNIKDTSLLGEIINDSQQTKKYKRSYLVKDRETNEIKINYLARTSEMMAYEIYKDKAKSVYSIIEDLKDNGFECSNYLQTKDNELEKVVNQIYKDNDFQRRMKYYCDYLQENPDNKEKIEFSKDVPYNLKKYYNILGVEKIKALNYQESKIINETTLIQKHQILKDIFNKKFKRGERYLKKEIKKMILEEYHKLNIKSKASATTLKTFGFQLRETKVNNLNAFYIL